MRANAQVFLGLLLPGLVLGSALAGCQKQVETESPTSGNLHFVCDEAVSPELGKEAAEFVRLYTKAAITCDSTTAREALIKFINRETKLVVLSRSLNPEEKKALAEAKFEYATYGLAKSGIAVVVNKQNPIDKLNLDQVRRIYSGEISKWNDVGGMGGKITPISLSRNSGTAEVFLQTVGLGSQLAPNLKEVLASRDLAGAVAADPSAIGFVGMDWISDKVKALELAPDSSNEFIAIHQASVYQGSYPLVQPIYAFTTSGVYGLASGFIAFLTSAPGQKIFLNSGLVPVTMPVKLIRID